VVNRRFRRFPIALFLTPAISAAMVTSPASLDPSVAHASGLATKKAPPVAELGEPPREPSSPTGVLATLVQTHTGERVVLDANEPTSARFSALLVDRVTGERREIDPRLLELLRALAKSHRGARIELVSGYRSPKLNEMLRKKGHHVASHSQHSLGHAVDFRIVDADKERGLDPRVLEREVRGLGFSGGVGVYLLESDWFVHADVGPNRRWGG
jgi:uncharacterized protein YcbK (DUF882 family)